MSQPADPVASPVQSILASILTAPWFAFVGARQNRAECEALLIEYLSCCGRKGSKFEWITLWAEAGAIARALDDETALWEEEEGFRRQAVDKLRALGRVEALENALNQLSEAGYERVRPNCPNEELARAGSGAALWTAAGAITWAMAEEGPGGEANPFAHKLRIFELGHWPLGVRRESFLIF